MDTTAAAELGMGDPDGAAAASFWHAGPAGSDYWGDPDDADFLDHDYSDDNADEDDYDNDLAWDRLALPPGAAATSSLPPASHSGFARASSRAAHEAEPPVKLLRSMPDVSSVPHFHGVPLPHHRDVVSSGHGAGPPSGRGHPSAAVSANFGGGGCGAAAVGLSPSGAGAVGRGRGMGSIFYKTKLCSRFRSGNCPYNTNCNFAHGMEELRKPPPGWEEFVASQEIPLPPPIQSGGPRGSAGAAGSTDSQVRFHKTRPCKKYFGEGNCPYGEKCNFLHDEQSVPRAVREAREAAVGANSGGVVAASPKVETTTLVPTTNGHDKETVGGGGSTSAGSAPPNARPSNWKTRLCNKWETTGHCPLGDKCHFAHGSGGKFDAQKSSLVFIIAIEDFCRRCIVLYDSVSVLRSSCPRDYSVVTTFFWLNIFVLVRAISVPSFPVHYLEWLPQWHVGSWECLPTVVVP